MRDIKELQELAEAGLLTKQISDQELQERADLIKQMVGWLYPRILLGETEKIRQLFGNQKQLF